MMNILNTYLAPVIMMRTVAMPIRKLYLQFFLVTHNTWKSAWVIPTSTTLIAQTRLMMNVDKRKLVSVYLCITNYMGFFLFLASQRTYALIKLVLLVDIESQHEIILLHGRSPDRWQQISMSTGLLRRWIFCLYFSKIVFIKQWRIY